MNIRIKNNCQKKYSFDPYKVTKRILEKIPIKFLDGLGEISIFDESTEDRYVRYLIGEKGTNASRIEIDMSGMMFPSILTFNQFLNTAIVDHVVKFLQPFSNDKDILAIRSSRVKLDWLYLEKWRFLIAPIKLLGLLYRNIKWYRVLVTKLSYKLLDRIT